MPPNRLLAAHARGSPARDPVCGESGWDGCSCQDQSRPSARPPPCQELTGRSPLDLGGSPLAAQDSGGGRLHSRKVGRLGRTGNLESEKRDSADLKITVLRANIAYSCNYSLCTVAPYTLYNMLSLYLLSSCRKWPQSGPPPLTTRSHLWSTTPRKMQPRPRRPGK